jgi:hypothetical protein
MEQKIKNQSESTGSHSYARNISITIRKDTKERLNGIRIPGQCYDGFIGELIDYWERYKIGSSLCGPGKPIHHDMKR